MEREVFAQELTDPQALIDEFVVRIPAKTLDQLLARIPEQVIQGIEAEKRAAS
jgi:hypothetical protein